MRWRVRRQRVTRVRSAEGRPPSIPGAEEASRRLAEQIRERDLLREKATDTTPRFEPGGAS